MHCADCFFQSGRSYLEPLAENLPHIPTAEMAVGRVVRMNDGNDSNNQRDLVERTASQYDDYFFNTSNPKDIGNFPGPVVLTINPGKITDTDFWEFPLPPANLMFVRFRANTWNVELLKEAVDSYTTKYIPLVITFMAYYKTPIPAAHKKNYEWRQRTLNSYWCIKKKAQKRIADIFPDNPLVHVCGGLCKDCGNCLREYYRVKEFLRDKQP